MTAIGAEMDSDAVGAGAFANGGSSDEIRLAVVGVEGEGVARLTERCDVIDINTKAEHL